MKTETTTRHGASSLPPLATVAAACQDLHRYVPEIILPQCRIGIVQVRPYRMPRGWQIGPHEHSFYETSIIMRGTARDARGRSQTLKPGHVFFHAPQTTHSWSSPADCTRFIVAFHVDPPVTASTPEQWPSWPWLLHDIARLVRFAVDRPHGWPMQVAASLSVILAQTLTLAHLPATAEPIDTPADTFVLAVDSFLEDNYAHAVSLQDVASHAGVSISGLVHRYRKLTGTTIVQRLLAVRMKHTTRLLKETDLPLKSICPRVGIDQPAYLCRLFQRHVGTTPTQYRKSAGRMGTSWS